MGQVGRGGCGGWCRVDLVAVSIGWRVNWFATNKIELSDLLFSFLVVLQLEDIDCQGLLMRSHFAQDDGSSFVVIRICHHVSKAVPTLIFFLVGDDDAYHSQATAETPYTDCTAHSPSSGKPQACASNPSFPRRCQIPHF